MTSRCSHARVLEIKKTWSYVDIEHPSEAATDFAWPWLCLLSTLQNLDIARSQSWPCPTWPCLVLKCDPNKYAVQYFAEKLLAAVIRSYLRVPWMSKILSQDKKNFAKFHQIFRWRKDISEELLESTFTVAESVVYPMIIVWKNFRFHQKFGEIWRIFFYLAIKSLTRVKPIGNNKLPLGDVFRQKSGLHTYRDHTLRRVHYGINVYIR